MAGRAAPTAIDPSRARGSRPCRQGTWQRLFAPVGSDRLAPKRSAAPQRARQQSQPGAEIVGVEASWRLLSPPQAISDLVGLCHSARLDCHVSRVLIFEEFPI